MRTDQSRLAPRTWRRFPRRTARLRLTSLYGGLFLISGAALVAVTYALFERATAFKQPHLPKVPHTPAIGSFQLPNAFVNSLPNQVKAVQKQLTQDTLKVLPTPSGVGGGAVQLQGPLTQVQDQLIKDQHQLAQATDRLATSVHQLAQAGSVQAAQRAADSHQLLVNSGIALGIVAVLAVLAGWLIAGRMLRPIRTITRTARRISSTSLHERLALDGPADELKELGDTLDDLFGRLDAAFEAQRHFVANASHELRTPLTAERTLLQVALDDPDTTVDAWRSTAKEVLASSDEQAHLIEALLTLASSESGLSEHEPVDLAATVGATLVDLGPEIERVGIHIEETTAPAHLDGDTLLVERLVANLLTNAVRHNLPEGRIDIVTGLEEGQAVLTVTNTGPLIPPAEVDRLFQPFQRLDRSRTHYKDGHGLGLSIVRAIATAHGASVSAHPMDVGGLSVRVIFPPPAAPPGPATSSQRSRQGHDIEVATP
jgi:signal transduction histidine kinase